MVAVADARANRVVDTGGAVAADPKRTATPDRVADATFDGNAGTAPGGVAEAGTMAQVRAAARAGTVGRTVARTGVGMEDGTGNDPDIRTWAGPEGRPETGRKVGREDGPEIGPEVGLADRSEDGTGTRALPSLAGFLADREALPRKGPVAVILIEDEAAVLETLRHHLARGFAHVLALSDRAWPLPPEMAGRVTQLGYDTRRPAAHVEAVNALIAALPPGTWMYYGFNAEFLFHPFCEARSVGEMLAFHAEERREAMLSYVIDLYAGDLARHPDAVDLEAPMLDAKGYYALGRRGADGTLHERQLDFHGGLRWRYEELLPADRRRIDRIALFRTAPGLRVGADHRFNVEEYNTYSCPWHHNLTAVVASFRVAKALVSNPGSRDEVRDLRWRNSVRFAWSSQQLMDLGLMEPGQWF